MQRPNVIQRLRSLLLLAPLLAFMIAFFVVPLVTMMQSAVSDPASANRLILIRTFVTAAMVTIACIAIGLPFAMIAASVEGWRRRLLLGAVLLPLWTSLLVRTAAWYVVLQDNGLINATLKALGII